MQNVILGIKNFFKRRGIGFYFTMGGVLLSVIEVIIYSVAFSTMDYAQYFSQPAVICSVFAIILGVGLSLTKWTESLAPVALGVLELAAFMLFIKDGYWYFTTQFFGGITMQAIVTTYYGYLCSIILFLLILGVSIASVFLRQSKQIKQTENEGGNEVCQNQNI